MFDTRYYIVYDHSVSSSKSYLAKCILSCTMSITGEGKLKGLEPNEVSYSLTFKSFLSAIPHLTNKFAVIMLLYVLVSHLKGFGAL